MDWVTGKQCVRANLWAWRTEGNIFSAIRVFRPAGQAKRYKRIANSKMHAVGPQRRLPKGVQAFSTPIPIHVFFALWPSSAASHQCVSLVGMRSYKVNRSFMGRTFVYNLFISK